MLIELDHLFVCTDPGGPEAEKLVQFGLREGPPNQHPGQGTACRRFSFANAMIELFWVNDGAQDAPCFGRDGLIGKVTPLLSASACGRSILKTQDHLSLHGSIGQPICQTHFPCRSAKRELRSQCGSI
jgi:hypothetical protein